MDGSCKGIYGLEGSLKLNYVLVMPKEQAAMLHNELLEHGVPERQIYEVDPNRRTRPQKFTNCRPAAAVAGGGDRKRGQHKRFMPSSIRLGTYAAGGQQFNVDLRRGSVWISMVDRPPAEDISGGASEVTVADGGAGASQVADGGGGGAAEAPPEVDRGVAVPEEDNRVTAKVQSEDGGGGREADVKTTAVVRGGDGENDDGDDNPNLCHDGRRCNSSSTLCDDCKRWLLNEYFGDRCPDEVLDQTGQHACIYRRIVDRLFVVTVTESGDCGGDEDEDDVCGDGGSVCCGKTTAADDGDDGPPSDEADHTTPEICTGQPERELRPHADPTTPYSQPAPATGSSSATPEPPTAGDGKPGKSKNKTFLSKLCGNSKKK